jgi:hypothetical protein
MSRPLFVAVLVELKRGLASGRHTKCWKRLAEATADCAELDVTVYVFVDRLSVDPIGPHARFVVPPPVLGTGRLSGTFGAVGATNLPPCHPGLTRRVRARRVAPHALLRLRLHGDASDGHRARAAVRLPAHRRPGIGKSVCQ